MERVFLLPSFLPSLMPSNRRRLSGPHSIPLHCSLERAAAARLLKMASHLLILSAESELLSMMSKEIESKGWDESQKVYTEDKMG